MSEYQYYEFQAVDRPLDKAAQQELRAISSRARITATSFTNTYEWGDFRGNPAKLMESWFDLHVYVANWGTRRLMIRVPQRFLDRAALDAFLGHVEGVELRTSGDNIVVDMHCQEEEPDRDWYDGSGWMASLAPLRADLLSGDLRLFYLLWLTAVQGRHWEENQAASDDEVEPLPGIGPLMGALDSFAAFFGIDPDLVQAAAEIGIDDKALSEADLRAAVAALPEAEKTALLLRVVEGDGLVGAELKRRLRKSLPAASAGGRTAGALRQRAREIAEARERADAEARETERRREAKEAEKARRVRVRALRQRGDSVWIEIESEIERRNASGYDRAQGLLCDMQALAAEDGSQRDFARRLAGIRARHEKKSKFIERLAKLGPAHDERLA